MQTILKLVYAHSRWATLRLLDTASELSEHEWQRGGSHSFGSVHATLIHLLSSEDLWLRRVHGESPTERYVTPERFPTLADLRTAWAPVAAGWQRLLDDAGPEALTAHAGYTTLDGRPAGYPVWQVVLHVTQHGSHHRSEVAAMLTDMGHPPLPLDFIVYLAEAKQV